MRRFLLLAITVLLAVVPTVALAQADDEPAADGASFQLNSDYRLAEGETADAVLVLNGDAHVEGTITGGLAVINGDARINGTVLGDIFVANGTLTLGPESQVEDVRLANSDLAEEPGAEITGQVDRDADWFTWPAGSIFLFGLAFWFAITIAVIVAGLLFAAIGGRQLLGATGLMTERVGQSILSGIIAMIGLPILAVLIMLTVVGVPLGLGMLFFLLPALVFLGYLVAGTWLGTLILNRTPAASATTRPFAAAALGLLIFQLLLLIPGVAPLIFLIASVWGAGGLVYLAWLAARGRRPGGPDAAPAPAPGA